jgi:hypothetical protein
MYFINIVKIKIPKNLIIYRLSKYTLPRSTTRGITEQFCGFDPWEPSSVSIMSNGILAHVCPMSE